jgi:hypothetical protein
MKRFTTISIIFATIIVLSSCHVLVEGKMQEVNINLIAKDPLQIEDFQIPGIKLGQEIIEVEKVYGKPIKKYLNKEYANNEFEFYEYPNFKVEYNTITLTVISISLKNELVKTPRGIKIGDEEKKVIYYYGRGKTYDKYKGKLFYQKTFVKGYSEDTCGINFLIVNGKVKEIKLYYAAN